jgi:hypothetical protein
MIELIHDDNELVILHFKDLAIRLVDQYAYFQGEMNLKNINNKYVLQKWQQYNYFHIQCTHWGWKSGEDIIKINTTYETTNVYIYLSIFIVYIF